MEKLKTKSVLIYDNGTFLPLAERLAKDFGKVMYFSPWEVACPKIAPTLIGKNLPKVERVNQFFDHLDEADIVVFPDCTDADLQIHLESLGYNIWGCRKGNELEYDRIAVKELLKKNGLPVGHYEVIKGTDKLRKYLKTHEDVYVKIEIFRGDFESFKSPNYKFIESRISDLETIFGCYRNEVEFIVEDDLPDKVELAYDGYTIDGQFPNKTLCGIEVKDLGYIGIFKDYDKLPQPVLDINKFLSPYLKRYNFRNFFSPEIRVGKDKKGYLIDNTTRFPSPPSEAYQYAVENYSEIIWEGAHGKCIDPKPTAKFVVEVTLNSEWAKCNWLPVQFSDKYKDNIKLRNCTIIDEEYYIIPTPEDTEMIGDIVASGNTIDEAMDKVNEIAEDLKTFKLDIPESSLDKAKEQIEKLKEMGYDLFK